MSESVLSAAILIHLGAMLYIIGFLVRDELVLRLLVLGGTFLYICYYFLFPETPLWDAIITSIILTAANVWVLVQIIFERTTFALNDEEKELYEVFNTLTPGQFRKVLKHSVWHTAAGGEYLCIEGQQATRLFYVLQGELRIQRGDREFKIQGQNFIGEVSFVLEGEYSANVVAEPGLKYVEWPSDALRLQMKKSLPFSNALTALFNRDLAAKLSVSHQ